MDIHIHPPAHPDAFLRLAMDLFMQAAAERLWNSRKSGVEKR